MQFSLTILAAIFQDLFIPTVNPAHFENADLFGPIPTQQHISQLHAQAKATALPPLIP